MFFSDLDRTLIYSKRFLTEEENEFIIIEKKEEKPISYISKKGYEWLLKIKKMNQFVPVTARTWEQATRIDFIKNEMPEWIVTESGCAIYHNGLRLKEWDEIIQKELSKIKNKKETLETFRLLFENNLQKEVTKTNEIMFIAKTKERSKEEEMFIQNFIPWFQKRNYKIYLQPTKVYLIPTPVSKEKAVSFLIKKLQITTSISAGDSNMDEDMLKETTYCYAPKHHTMLLKECPITKETGIKAGEEISKYAYQVLHDTKKRSS